MTRSSVFTSGAGMSRSGPSMGAIWNVYRRVSRSSSPTDNWRGSQRTPPLPPPNGMLTTAVLSVMSAASAATSAALRSGWNLIPPLAGPRAVL